MLLEDLLEGVGTNHVDAGALRVTVLQIKRGGAGGGDDLLRRNFQPETEQLFLIFAYSFGGIVGRENIA